MKKGKKKIENQMKVVGVEEAGVVAEIIVVGIVDNYFINLLQFFIILYSFFIILYSFFFFYFFSLLFSFSIKLLTNK
jgi:hypothetical protein